MNRRRFIRASVLASAGVGLARNGAAFFRPAPMANPLPQWKGFNLTDFFSPHPNFNRPGTTEDHFRWMADWGFDFVRIPIAYPWYLDIDRQGNIAPEDVYKINQQAVERIVNLVNLAHKYNLHTSLNLHRAPGYCINAGFHEPFNLWKDEEAQKAFYWHWNMWARIFRSESPMKISFDLVNEPSMRDDMNDQHSPSGPVPGEIYRKVAGAALEAIRKENPEHLVIADGNNGGNTVIAEITDLPIAQSCRGYNPGSISHYRAPWANSDPEHMPVPQWPMQIGNRTLNRQMLEKYYEPWIALAHSGTGVHCGECGCWNKTPHAVFLDWFSDVLDILTGHGIGFALWNFEGDFGVLNSGRADVEYEDWHGYKLDRKLLDLLRRA